MNLSIEEKAILAHVVPDPDEWVSNALASHGEKAVKEKINKYRDDYLACKDDPNYLTRAERKAADDAAQAEKLAQIKADNQAALDSYIADLINQELDKRA